MFSYRRLWGYWGTLVAGTLVICAIAALLGCSTPYKSEGLGGGFSEIPLSGDTYQVSVRGNGFTSADKVRKIALVRAADIALQHGYDRFMILGMDGHQTQRFGGYTPGSFSANTTGQASIYGNTIYGSSQTTGSYAPAQPVIVTNEHAQFTIKLLRAGSPGYENALDAQAMLSRFGPEVGRS